MKVTVTREEVLGCKDFSEVLDLLATRGINPARPLTVKGNYQGGDFIVTQGDEKKDRNIGSAVFGYCYSCKDVTEVAGEHCSECECFIGGE